MEALLHFIINYGWLAVIAVIFAESGLMVGFFLPGDSLLFVAGTLVQSGIFPINVFVFILCLFLAAVLGNTLGYFIGRKFGRRLFDKPNSKFFRKEYLIQAEKFYEKNGPKTVMIAMFVPVVRAFSPVAAGIAHMPYRIFISFNIIGAFIWTSLFVLTGYLAGGIIVQLGINIEIATLIIITLSFLPGIIHILKDPKNRHRISRRLRRIVKRN